MLAHRTAFLFPGQGSQRPAMAGELARADDELSARYLDAADDLLGLPLGRLCREGTSEALRPTEIAQPAILLTSLLAGELLRRDGVEPAVVAGHSLGEYTALVVAGVLAWPDALRLVHHRGRLMARVGDRVPGGMVAVLGVEAEQVAQLCGEVVAATGELVEVANYNSDRQTVVSGTVAGVDAVVSGARTLGADVARLKVSAPFHSSLMREIESEFAAALSEVAFHTPRIPVVSTVSAAPVLDGAAAAALLRRQLCAPVRWAATVRALVAQEVAALVEVGPGRVLTSLNTILAPGVPALAVGSASDVRTVARTLREG